MSAVFLNVVNRSITALWLIAAVMLLRLLLRRAPKWAVCLLWAVVAVRLICPISIESVFSLIPSAETLPEQVISGPSFDIQTGIEPIDVQVNDYLGDRYFEGVTVPAENGANVMELLSAVWLLGMLVLGGYGAVRYVQLRRLLATAVRLRDGVWQSEYVSSPFVLGFFAPRIYLPFGMDSGDEVHVIAHEQAHIARLDHWWKLLGFGVLTIHWFNPLVWAAYGLFCRDLELACDERVIRGLSCEQRADYTRALVRCSLSRSRIAACPLAFGEVGVKARVRAVLNYRAPAFWIAAAAVVLCILAAVCFLTDPVPSREFDMAGDSISDLTPGQIVERIRDVENLEDHETIYMNADNFDLRLNGDLTWADSQSIRYFFYRDGDIFTGQLRIFPEEDHYYITQSRPWVEQEQLLDLRSYLDALKYLPQEQIRAFCPDARQYILRPVEGGGPDMYERSITYTMGGAGKTDGWYVHLQVLPVCDQAHGNIELFYGGSVGSSGVFKWFDRTMDLDVTRSVELSAFPGVEFQYDGSCICAWAEDRETGGTGYSVLLNGMPIWDAYFCDLTGDGLPEICTTQSWGSGMIDERVVIFDYAAGRSYTLEDRGTYDYSLRLGEDGWLYADRRRYTQSEVVGSFRLICRDGTIALEHDRDLTADPFRFTARVLEVRDASLLVEPVPGSRELSTASRIEVCLDQRDLQKELAPGDTVVIAYDGQLQETYPARIPDGALLLTLLSQKVDLDQMVLADGWIYCGTGRAVPAEIDPSAVLGQITSTVSSFERPEREGQSNFGYIGADYARFEDGIVVLLDGEWYYFEPEG